MSGILKITIASAVLAAAFVLVTELRTTAPAGAIQAEQPQVETAPAPDNTAPRRGVRVISLSPRQA